MAPVIDGVFTEGASMSTRSAASRAAWAVVAPKVAIQMLSCLKSGKFFQQRLYTLRAEKHKHVVVEGFVGGEVVADGTIHFGTGVRKVVLRQKFLFRAVIYI